MKLLSSYLHNFNKVKKFLFLRQEVYLFQTLALCHVVHCEFKSQYDDVCVGKKGISYRNISFTHNLELC
jgi:hypothetical protein